MRYHHSNHKSDRSSALTLNRLRPAALACAGIFLLCELLCWPFAELGIADDWSYISMARTLSLTGHIAYNGWPAAIIGWQLYLAAFLYKLFGFSFTSARITTLAIGCLVAFFMQRTLVRLGISSFNAAIGTLVFVLSPLFMMLSATFMTDVPGFFAILICFYACTRALQASSSRNIFLWIVFAIVANCICGSSRQIAWLGVLVIVPSTLWVLRTRRNIFFAGASVLALGWIFVFATLRWFAHRPYALTESLSLPPRTFTVLAGMIGQYDRALLTITLMLLPIMAIFLFEMRHWRRRSFVLAAAITVFVGLVFFSIRHVVNIKDILSPFVGDWVGIRGSYNGVFLNGQQPPVLIGHYLHLFLGPLTLASLLCAVVTVLSPAPALPATPPEPLTPRQILWLFGPFSLVYTLLLINRAEQFLFDRYTLAPIFVILFVLIRFYQRHVRPTLPAASIALLCLLASYGMICTHNLFAMDRARVVLGKEILDAGINPNAIDFGWDQNGWVALQQDPAVNYFRIVNPPNFYQHIVDPQLSVCYGQSVLFGIYPRLAPQYGIAFSPNACAGPAPFAPVSYTSWPDLRRVTLYAVHYPPPWRPESDYIVPTATPR